MENLHERILKVMSLVFEVSVETLNEDSSSDTIGSWDSLKHLNLILALEEEFNVEIPDEEVGNLMNYKLIKLVVEEINK
jgi:acyl carrier protein